MLLNIENLPHDYFRFSVDDGGEWLHIRTNQARRFCGDLQHDKTYVVEIKQMRKRRSLDANAYCWVLIGRLSEKLRIPKTEVYQQYIKEIGGNYTIVPVREDRLEQWNKVWCEGHLGRQTEDVGACRQIPGYHNVISYIGSSDYDNKQMSRLIDLVVQDCKEQGIETLTPFELNEMKERWNEQTNKGACNP